MVNKIRISPAQAMVKQWLTNFRMMGPIESTSLVTRIASNMGILDGNPVPFIEEPRVMIDEAYLVQGHKLKKRPDDSFVFFLSVMQMKSRCQTRDITCITAVR